MAELAGRVAVVTGGGWNIGRAVALAFAREGAAVAVAGRRAALLEETAEAIRRAGGRALAVPTDVTEPAQVEELERQARKAFGPVDLLAALAGGSYGLGALDAIDPAEWERAVRVNLFGTFHCVRAVLPSMRVHRHGAIVTCAGGGAFFPWVGQTATAYAAAKAAVCRFTDQLAVELWDSGIRVNCLQPGLTWSPWHLEQVAEEERRTGRPHPDRAANHPPEDAAELALWLASGRSAPLHGRIVSVDDAWWRTADAATLRRIQASPHALCLRRAET